MSQSKARAPRDPLEAFTSFSEYLQDTRLLIESTSTAYAAFLSTLKLRRSSELSKEVAERLDRVERHAIKEIKEGFPVLMRQTSVTIWSALEACMSSFAVHWLCHRPQLLSSPRLSKVKVPASVLSVGDKLEVAELVLDEYERREGNTLKAGVGRFKLLLDALDLSVTVSDVDEKNLLELSKVRNLILHQYGVVDVRFKKSCSWVDCELDKPLVVTVPMVSRYIGSVRQVANQTQAAATASLSASERA
jgi:hypothetical protein